MSTPRPQITLMVHRDGEVGSRTFRMPIWLFRVLVVLGTVLLMAALVAGALYAPLLKAAASVPRLREEVARLEAETAKVRELAAALDSAERVRVPAARSGRAGLLCVSRGTRRELP